jgi:O-succinylbenzoate synthase
MRIESVHVYHVAMPLVYPFRTAFGDEDCIESVLVRMGSGEQAGWGEASPWRLPAYSAEWAAGAFMLVRDWLAPLLIGRDIASGEELQRALGGIKGNFFAKASLDLAWWDLYARLQSRPLWRVIGGTDDTVIVGADIGVMEGMGELLAEVEKARTAGFRRIKLKYRPGWELDMLAAVRTRFPDVVAHIDCNSAYSLDDLAMFQEVDQYGLAMIEQPLAHDDLLDHARLQEMIQTPICLDESITSVTKARQAIELGACRWINIKAGRVGGLTNALAIRDLCQEAGVPCWVGGMLESAIGQGHSTALATLPNMRYPSDIFPSDRFYEEDLGEPPVTLSGPSQIRATSQPGIGCEPNPERLPQRAVQMAVVA